MKRFVIKTTQGFVTSHRRGRMAKTIESARTFKTYRGASTNRFMSQGRIAPRILEIDVKITIVD